jgi:hypothetical protein
MSGSSHLQHTQYPINILGEPMLTQATCNKQARKLYNKAATMRDLLVHVHACAAAMSSIVGSAFAW